MRTRRFLAFLALAAALPLGSALAACPAPGAPAEHDLAIQVYDEDARTTLLEHRLATCNGMAQLTQMVPGAPLTPQVQGLFVVRNERGAHRLTLNLYFARPAAAQPQGVAAPDARGISLRQMDLPVPPDGRVQVPMGEDLTLFVHITPEGGAQ